MTTKTLKAALPLKAILIGAGLTLAALTASSGMAQASAVLVDDGSYTYDSNTNLDWLDLTATTGVSVSDVLANNGVSYIAAGWHYASLSDLLGLFQDAGLSTAASPTTPGLYGTMTDGPVGSETVDTNILGLINFLGQTYDLGGGGSAATFGSFAGSGGVYGYAGLLIAYHGEGYLENATLIADFANNSSIPARAFGNFLIRDHAEVVTPPTVTPLPAALPLFAAATSLLGFVGWRRKRNDQA